MARHLPQRGDGVVHGVVVAEGMLQRYGDGRAGLVEQEVLERRQIAAADVLHRASREVDAIVGDDQVRRQRANRVGIARRHPAADVEAAGGRIVDVDGARARAGGDGGRSAIVAGAVVPQPIDDGMRRILGRQPLREAVDPVRGCKAGAVTKEQRRHIGGPGDDLGLDGGQRGERRSWGNPCRLIIARRQLDQHVAVSAARWHTDAVLSGDALRPLDALRSGDALRALFPLRSDWPLRTGASLRARCADDRVRDTARIDDHRSCHSAYSSTGVTIPDSAR